MITYMRALDEFGIWPDPTTGSHGDRYGYDGKKRCLHFFSAVFHLFLFILAGNDDMHESSDEFEFGLIGPTTAELAALKRLKKSP